MVMYATFYADTKATLFSRDDDMSLNIKDLENHVVSIRQQISELEAELAATELLINTFRARQPETTNGTKYKNISVESAVREFFKYGNDGWFTVQEVAIALQEGGSPYPPDSLKANIGNTLKLLTDKGLLLRKDISKTLIRTYAYSLTR